MKKNVLAFSTLLLMFMTLFSCKKENNLTTNDGTPDLKPLARQSMTIGVIHNQALQYCYSYLQTQSNLYELTLEQRMTIIKNKIGEYLIDNNPYGIDQNTINQFYNNSPFTIQTGINYFNTDQEQRISNLLSNYSGTKQSIVEDIFEAVDSSETLSDLQSALDVIVQQSANLSQEDQDEINSFMSVAENSWAYWVEEDGIDNWKNLFKDPNLSERSRPDIAKAAIKGDIEGAITGALTGAGFAGVGALAGALIGAPLASGWAALWAI